MDRSVPRRRRLKRHRWTVLESRQRTDLLHRLLGDGLLRLQRGQVDGGRDLEDVRVHRDDLVLPERHQADAVGYLENDFGYVQSTLSRRNGLTGFGPPPPKGSLGPPKYPFVCQVLYGFGCDSRLSCR